MRSDPAKFESADAALRELHEAERAGVFRRSPLNADSILPARPVGYRLSRVAKAWIAAAAAFVLLAGSWNLVFYREFGEMRERLTASNQRRAQGQIAAMLACVGGPTSGLSDTCGAFDSDSDGDVDLADLRLHQLYASAHP